jgi:hypothetical protein
MPDDDQIFVLVFVTALHPQTPKHISGGWSYYTDTSELVYGMKAQNSKIGILK